MESNLVRDLNEINHKIHNKLYFSTKSFNESFRHFPELGHKKSYVVLRCSGGRPIFIS